MREAWDGVGPGLEPVPHAVEVVLLVLCKVVVELELCEQLVQRQAV